MNTLISPSVNGASVITWFMRTEWASEPVLANFVGARVCPEANNHSGPREPLARITQTLKSSTSRWQLLRNHRIDDERRASSEAVQR